jgi:integrase/recombinase XerC
MNQLIPSFKPPILKVSKEERLSNLSKAFLKGRKDTTTQAYRQDLECFREYLGLSSVEEVPSALLSLEPGEANALGLDYRDYLKKDRMFQPASINRKLASLRSLIKFARTLGLITWTLEVKNEKAQAYRDTSGIPPEVFLTLLNKTSKQRDKAKAARDIAILRLMYDLGLRRAEVLGLDLEDLDFDTHSLSIIGKGRTEKEKLSLSPQAKASLMAWIEARGDHKGAIFTDFDRAKKNQGRLTPIGLTLLVRALGARIGVKLSPHKLRHSAITQACKLAQANGIDLEEVLDFSRHKDVRTLMIYRDRERNVQGLLASLVGATA